MSPDDLAENIEEPLGSLPARLVEMLPRLNLFLVPYLQTVRRQPDLVVFEQPSPELRSECFQIVGPDDASLLLAVQEISGNEIHYNLFNAIASLAWEVATPEIRAVWSKDLKDELRREVHGEIDEPSWQKKNELLARQSPPIRESKLFRDYARQSFIDTATLFLHGICCDIDVEPSPRQVPSSEIRRRLELLRRFYPLPEGSALFPEELSRGRSGSSPRRGTAGEPAKKQMSSGLNLASLPGGEPQSPSPEDAGKPEA